MSYILDALKRADAERERGAAPGLHTRHQLPSGSPSAPSASRNLWLTVAGSVTLVMLAVGFWVWRASGNPPAAPLKPAAINAPNTAAPSASITASAPPPAVTTPMTPAPVAVAEAPKVQALPVPTPSAAKAAPSPPSRPALSARTTDSAPPATPVSPVATAAPAAAPLLGELPQDIRSQIPKITITGSVYSDSPTQRLLLVNNLVLPQGGQIATDLTLVEVQPRSSVFRFKGTRFRVMH